MRVSGRKKKDEIYKKLDGIIYLILTKNIRSKKIT